MRSSNHPADPAHPQVSIPPTRRICRSQPRRPGASAGLNPADPARLQVSATPVDDGRRRTPAEDMLLLMPVRARFTEGPVLGPDFPLALDRPFTTTEALSAGVSRAVLSRLLRDGYLRRLLKGVHVAAQAPDSLLLRAQALR